MYRVMSIVLTLVVAVALSAGPAWAKGKKGGKAPTIPAGYAKVESVDSTAKTFKLTDDAKTYKFTDATTNKDAIYAGAVIKVTLKDGSADEVSAIDTAPAKKKGKKNK